MFIILKQPYRGEPYTTAHILEIDKETNEVFFSIPASGYCFGVCRQEDLQYIWHSNSINGKDEGYLLIGEWTPLHEDPRMDKYVWTPTFDYVYTQVSAPASGTLWLDPAMKLYTADTLDDLWKMMEK